MQSAMAQSSLRRHLIAPRRISISTDGAKIMGSIPAPFSSMENVLDYMSPDL